MHTAIYALELTFTSFVFILTAKVIGKGIGGAIVTLLKVSRDEL